MADKGAAKVARDPMRLLLTIRRQSVEQARHALAACLAVEAVAADRLRALEEAAQRDRAGNRAVAEAHLFVDMFARRLQANAESRRSAEAVLMQARGASAEAQAALVAARTATEAVETLIEERAATTEADAAKREQHALDDMARTRFDTAAR